MNWAGIYFVRNKDESVQYVVTRATPSSDHQAATIDVFIMLTFRDIFFSHESV